MIFSRHFIFGIALISSLVFQVHAQTPNSIKGLMEKHKITGTSFAVVKAGKIVELDALGHANLQKKEKLTIDHYFQVASMSKMISSMMVLCLQKRYPDIINLNTPFSYYLKDRIDPDSVTARWVEKAFDQETHDYLNEINFQRLLSHSAGMSVHGIGTYPGIIAPSLQDILYSGFFQGNVGPMWAPGTKYSYSGGGFTVAESMIQDLLNHPADTLFERELKECLEIKGMTWKNATEFTGPIAHGHYRQQLTFDLMNSPVEMAGGLLSTPQAYAEVVIKIMNNFDSDLVSQLLAPSLHRKSSLDQCSNDQDCTVAGEKCFNNRCGNGINAGGNFYGLGVSLSKSRFNNLPKIFSHSGYFLGFNTRFKANRKSQDAIIIFTNTDSVMKMSEPDMENEEKNEIGPDTFNKQMISYLSKAYQLQLN